jgi:hypothetical protein
MKSILFVPFYLFTAPISNYNNPCCLDRSPTTTTTYTGTTSLLWAEQQEQEQQQQEQQSSLSSSSDSIVSTTTTTTITNIPTKRFYVDGNNLMGHKGTPKNPQEIANQLRNVTSTEIILVFDGPKKKEQSKTSQNKIEADDDSTPSPPATTTTTTTTQIRSDQGALFRQVYLGQGLLTDDYIKQDIQELLLQMRTSSKRSDTILIPKVVEVVTADRILRREVLTMKPIVRGVINPVVFWKRYRPRLTGLKSNYQNQPFLEQDE